MEFEKDNKNDNRKEEEKFTIADIIGKMEERGELFESPRSIEWKWRKVIKRLNSIRDKWSFEDESFVLKNEQKVIVQAIITEIACRSEYTEKIITDNLANITAQDVIEFYDGIFEFTDGKIEKEDRICILKSLDEDIRYDVWLYYESILNMVRAIMINIEKWPYAHQVKEMDEVFALVRERFGENLGKMKNYGGS